MSIDQESIFSIRIWEHKPLRNSITLMDESGMSIFVTTHNGIGIHNIGNCVWWNWARSYVESTSMYLLHITHYSLCDAWNSIRNNFFALCARRPYIAYFFRPGSDVPYLRNGLQIPFAIHWRLHFFLVQYYSHFTVGNLLHPIDVQIDHVCPEDFNCTDLWPNKDVMLLVKKKG